jgi:hypothetical protein
LLFEGSEFLVKEGNLLVFADEEEESLFKGLLLLSEVGFHFMEVLALFLLALF